MSCSKDSAVLLFFGLLFSSCFGWCSYFNKVPRFSFVLVWILARFFLACMFSVGVFLSFQRVPSLKRRWRTPLQVRFALLSWNFVSNDCIAPKPDVEGSSPTVPDNLKRLVYWGFPVSRPFLLDRTIVTYIRQH